MTGVIMGPVIRSFRDRGAEDVFDGADTAAARRTCPRALWPVAWRRLDQLDRVRGLRDLAVPPGNRLERLRADRRCRRSIRMNAPRRACLRWETGDTFDVEIADYH